jgi:hypothetical protein
MQTNSRKKSQKHTEKTQRKCLVHNYVILRAQAGACAPQHSTSAIFTSTPATKHTRVFRRFD